MPARPANFCIFIRDGVGQAGLELLMSGDRPTLVSKVLELQAFLFMNDGVSLCHLGCSAGGDLGSLQPPSQVIMPQPPE